MYIYLMAMIVVDERDLVSQHAKILNGYQQIA